MNAEKYLSTVQKGEKHLEFRLDAYCGLYCGACPNLLKTKAGTETEKCYGCKSALSGQHCQYCGIMACAKKKGFEFCSECAERPTCAELKRFVDDPKWPYHKDTPHNLEAIKTAGITQWLADQEARWCCAACSTPVSWWDKKCPKCGQPCN